MSLSAAVKDACNPSLNEKLPDRAQKAPVLQQPVPMPCASPHSREAICPFEKLRKQRRKTPE